MLACCAIQMIKKQETQIFMILAIVSVRIISVITITITTSINTAIVIMIMIIIIISIKYYCNSIAICVAGSSCIGSQYFNV